MNRSLADVGGGLLIVSQFTLYGDCRKGNRPSFTNAARPEIAIPLYEAFIARCRESGLPVETGEFGADKMCIRDRARSPQGKRVCSCPTARIWSLSGGM